MDWQKQIEIRRGLTVNAFFRKRAIRYPLLALSLLGIIAAVYLLLNSFWLGLIFSILFIVTLALTWRIEDDTYLSTEKHIKTLSHRVKKVGEEALLELPIGIILINDEQDIEWTNPFTTHVFHADTLVGQSLFDISESLQAVVQSEKSEPTTIKVDESAYTVFYNKEEKLIYLFDSTEQVKIESLYEADKTVLGIILVDNYDELSQAMDDQTRSQLNSKVTSLVTKWGIDNGVYIKRTNSDRFLAVFNEASLAQIESARFSILDDIREATTGHSAGLTLSIGVGVGSRSLIELGELAQSSLDLVLGRGGDQVAIKQVDGKVKFYGGKTNPAEKRTRVRARVISHALRDLIQDSDRVFVMGHKMPDMDAIGASIGVRKMACLNQVEGYVILDSKDIDGSLAKLMGEIKQDESLYDHFIDPETALGMMTEQSLVVVVDTHKPSLVIDERIVEKAEKVVVIDHHRRGEEFIDNTMLVYMEPYASSTAELVTELLEYQPKTEKLTRLESTALLAGIIVDTKSFTLRTGSRTFEAASFLRTNQADTVLVQHLLKEDIDTYVERAKLVESVEIVDGSVAIAKGDSDRIYGSVLIAQTADILLTMEGITASFVVGPRSDGKIGISARSLGELNVQVVMEELGGGGHLTNAACQLNVESVEEAVEQLKEVLNKEEEERGS